MEERSIPTRAPFTSVIRLSILRHDRICSIRTTRNATEPWIGAPIPEQLTDKSEPSDLSIVRARTPAGNPLKIEGVGFDRDRADGGVAESPGQEAAILPVRLEPDRQFVFLDKIDGMLKRVLPRDLARARRLIDFTPAQACPAIDQTYWIGQPLSPFRS